MSFHERLTDLRQSTYSSRKEMADYLGMTQTAYGYYETGKRKPPLNKVVMIAKFFDVSIAWLLGYDDESVWRKKYEEVQRQLDAIRKILGDEH